MNLNVSVICMKETTLKSTKQYECFFMELYEDDVRLPDGKTSKRIWIDHPGAAAALPITKDGRAILIRQYRYPIRSVTIEVPAGKKDVVGEDGIACVRRELEEETGHASDDIVKVMDMHSCLGYSNELIELYLARDCYPLDNPDSGDDDEFIEVFHATREEAGELLRNGQITDAKTIILLQRFIHDNHD